MEAKTTRRSGSMLIGLLGCAGVAALCGTLLVCVRLRAGSRALEQRSLVLRDDVRAWRAPPSARPTRGGTPIDGDAADRYAVALWALADGSSPAPARGSTTLERVRGGDLDALLERPLDASAVEALRTYQPIVEVLREGLRCERCDWRVDLRRGVLADDSRGAGASSRAAKLLALAAEAGADGGIAARGCLDVIALGADVTRAGTFMAALEGADVKRVGLEALLRVLSARRLSAEQCGEVVDALRELGPTDVGPTFETERLMWGVTWAGLSGHPVGPGRRDSFAERYEILGLMGPEDYRREWLAFDVALEDVAAEASRAPSARVRGLDVLGDLAASSDAWLPKQAIPFFTKAQPLIDEANLLAQQVRVLAAAHQARAETGAFPCDATALAPRLGDTLPLDPPLTFWLDDQGSACCGSVGAPGFVRSSPPE